MLSLSIFSPDPIRTYIIILLNGIGYPIFVKFYHFLMAQYSITIGEVLEVVKSKIKRHSPIVN